QTLETEITQLKANITSLNIQLNAYKIECKTASNCSGCTRVKPASRDGKPSLKRVPQPIKSLPAKQESRKRVEVYHRNLNKLNRVDSRLNFKPNGFVSDSIAVCKMCDECLFAFNHDKCVVRYLNSVNAKPSSAKRVSIPTKQVWRARGKVETSVRQEW
nr:hypothetical protein [Tanacetum cinerariifolium]